ncbi:hypothetical protein THARTR1_01144 [Trichoderma harzianum]|uniref:Uncharacterized protein n=1 Tax=Trichoderma harzianum TaxID=5544 RepID=A0A2K0UM90_TRIHA|nr:hypothetical protein THARTR1_01144 [Trichoderma harzianum]
MQRIQGQLCGPDGQSLTGVTRDEFLWYLRTEREERHRWATRDPAVLYTYTAPVYDAAAANWLPDLPSYHWLDTCNKSVPVYMLPGERSGLLRVVLHNYIYRRWFRPYRSEIDYNRFICKFIYPQPQDYGETISLPMVHDIISINQAICAKVEAQRSVFMEEYNSYGRFQFQPRGISPACYILQPLFRALLILVSDKKYNKETSKTVGSLPVYLVRTGIEEGLSAPISFEPIATKILSHSEPGRAIEVTVETAIDFAMELEAREAAAFGLRPNPVTDWEPYEDEIEAWKSMGETEPLVGPNSQWVDSEKYPQWTGEGERCDSVKMVRLEEQQFRLQVKFDRRREEYMARQTAAESAAPEKLTG